MPNSSRRKQSKPQHVLNEEEEGDATTAGNNHSHTSTHTSTPGDTPTQEGQYGSKATTGQYLWENGENNNSTSSPSATASATLEGDGNGQFGRSPYAVKVLVDDYGVDGSDTEGHESLVPENGEEEEGTESLPHDLSMKRRGSTDAGEADVAGKGNNNGDAAGSEGEGSMRVYTPPSAEQLLDRFTCQDCGQHFKSSDSLQQHGYITHGIEAHNVNIAQRGGLERKRPLEDAAPQPRPNGNHLFPPDTDSRSSTSPVLLIDSPTNLSCSPVHSSDMASKRQKTGGSSAPHSIHSRSSSVLSSSDMGLDLKLGQPTSVETGARSGSSMDGVDLGDGARACAVCAKVFPKPSDLKRHMMCHTGEKPFRCELCQKPFRAKSSMHYHLKATHGIEIELSPGLEERYMRMKTRTHMNMLNRGNMMSYPYKDNIDIDDIEDDTKSSDSSSFVHHTGSDFKEPHTQGLYSNTGMEEKEAMDLSTSEKSRQGTRGDCTEQKSEGEVLIAAEEPFRKSKISIQNETVVITRLDGFNVQNGENASIFKCWLCGKMFRELSSMQCHLSLHFERQVTSYECCFCNTVFQFKTQMSNHIRRRHQSQFRGGRRGRRAPRHDNETKETSSDTGKTSGKQKKTMYRCRFCRKTFNERISLDKHLKLHFWNKNCFCRICGKSFQHYTSLQLHISRFHWKTGWKANGSSLHGKFNFFNTSRFHPHIHDGVHKPDNCQPLDLIKSKTYQNDRHMSLPNPGVTVVLPQAPPIDNGELSDTGASHHSSENNWSESLSDSAVLEYDETGTEIKTAPKRSLMSFRRENSPRHKTSRKSMPSHIPPQNHSTSDNTLPLNFVKTEPAAQQDSNNNESSSSTPALDCTPGRLSPGRLSPDKKSSTPGSGIHESLLPGYALNATNHLLMAKALAAHQSLAQHLNHSSSQGPLIYPPTSLPPSLAAMTQMMSLPVSVQVPGAEARAGTSKSPSPASHSSSKSDTSPEDRDRDLHHKELRGGDPPGLLGYPRVQWGQPSSKGPDWTFNMYCPSDTSHTDGRKVTSLSRTHSREAICKPTTLMDGRIVYKCPFCSKEFVSFSDINRHMDFHEDIRPYKCQYCDYYARTNSQLKVHMMRHQGIREFCCKLCNYKGVTQSDLNRHMKSQIHMLKSRNACSHCGEGFVTPKNLEKHLDGNCIVKMQKLNGGLDIRIQESVA